MSNEVTFYTERGFGGASRTQTGVGSVDDLRGWGGDNDFFATVKSIKVGSDVVLRAFSETDHQHDELTMLPEEERDRLDSNGFERRIKSFKVYDAAHLHASY